MKYIIQFILKVFSRAILKKYKPDVIGITGSVGKSSTKTAIHTLLEDSYKIRSSPKSYNTEIGVPLTIIGLDNPARSILGWLKVFLHAIRLLISRDKDYPRILILEMAADQPGDIKYLVSFAKPKVGIITSVGPTHLEFFGSVQSVAQEKANMISGLAQSSYAIINTDQKILADLTQNTKAKLITYGLRQADLTARDIKINQQHGGLSFNLNYRNFSMPVKVPNLLGQPAVYSLLAAAAVGLCYGFDLNEIVAKLKNYQALPGRLNLLPGIKYTQIIDDSYNSSPLAAQAALETLAHLKCSGSKFVILGDLLELGEHTQSAHQQIGQLVVKSNIDYLITVGKRSIETAKAAKDYGMHNDRIFSFDNSVEAGKFLQDKIQEGDLILIKGSAAMAMQKITKEIMAQPDRAKEVLVRQ
jgi:UDP-N-acetylmuramoyl-tripeptide--D-alanyl-D-alanine ligase